MKGYQSMDSSNLTDDIYAAALRELDDNPVEETPSSAASYDRDQTYAHAPMRRRRGGFIPYDENSFERRPIGVVTSDDLERRKPPIPRLFAGEHPAGVRLARAGEVRFSPKQPTSHTARLLAVVASAIILVVTVYTLLIVTNRLPVPAVMMYESTRTVGKTLTRASDISKAPAIEIDQYKNKDHGEALNAFESSLLDALNPSLKALGSLGLELGRGGVPDLKQISILNEQAKVALQTTKTDLNALAIPEGTAADYTQYLDKVLLAADAFVEQGQNTVAAIEIGCDGHSSGFSDATFSANNIERNKDNLIADLKRAVDSVGTKGDASSQKTVGQSGSTGSNAGQGESQSGDQGSSSE